MFLISSCGRESGQAGSRRSGGQPEITVESADRLEIVFVVLRDYTSRAEILLPFLMVHISEAVMWK